MFFKAYNLKLPYVVSSKSTDLYNCSHKSSSSDLVPNENLLDAITKEEHPGENILKQ